MGKIRMVYKLLVGKLEGKRPLERVIIKWILKRMSLRMWTGFNWLKVGSSGGLCSMDIFTVYRVSLPQQKFHKERNLQDNSNTA
jgi:hypothetical protein